MEERYVNMPRRHSDRRESPPQRRAGYREEPPRRRPSRYEEPSGQRSDYREAPLRRQSPSRRTPKGGRPPVVTAAIWLYKALVVISAIIVAVYLGSKLLIRAPEQNQLQPPPQHGGTAEPSGSGNTSVSDPGDVVLPQLEREEGVYTVFLAATDRAGSLTDVMMLMRYDTNQQTVGVVSIPRDTLVAREKGNPHLVYGGGGLKQRVADVSNMLGVPIDYYVKVNISGFIALVDELQGIDFYVPCDMNYDDPAQNLAIHFKEGMQHLNGQQAMEVARFRKNNDGSGYTDVGRTQTQQKLLVAMAKKALSWNSLTKLNSFVEIFNHNVDTDLSMNNMLYFASQAMNLDPSTGVETATLPGRGDAVYRGYSYCYELDPEGTLELVNRLINPYKQSMTLEDMNLAKAQRYM